MEPEIRYCTASDGVRIAYTVTGEGPPHVYIPVPLVSHVQLEWSQPLARRMLRELARHNMLIRFDGRGSGLSDRVNPKTVDDAVLDFEAVADRLGLHEFGLTAAHTSALPAIAFAARHAERVRRLVLVDGFTRFADFMSTSQIESLLALIAKDWEMATEAIGSMAFGPGRDESVTYGAYIRACVAPGYFENQEVTRSWDVSALASSLKMPTLVLHHSGIRYVTPEMTIDLASRIPDARFATIEGAWADDQEGLAKRIAAFINDEEQEVVSRQHGASGVRTVLFTDLVGHTEMMHRLGDARGREVLREHERITRDAIRQHGGIEIKTDGDSFMVSFSSVTAAMECAVDLQRAFADRNETNDEPFRVRMGLNAGEPIEEGGDLFGEAVILAARIAAQAGEGEILIAEPVRHLLAGKGFIFADRGQFILKGFEDAVRLYEARWRA